MGVMDKNLALIMFAVGIDFLGITIILPILTDIGTMYNADPVMIGLIFTSYGLAQTISNPITGRLSDRFGRKKILLISLMGSIVGFALMGLAIQINMSLEAFIGFRFLAGFAGSAPPIAKAYVSDVVDHKLQPKVFSIFGAVVGASFALGPAIGGTISVISLAAPCFFGASMSLLGFLATLFFFQEKKIVKTEDLIIKQSVPQVVVDETAVNEAFSPTQSITSAGSEENLNNRTVPEPDNGSIASTHSSVEEVTPGTNNVDEDEDPRSAPDSDSEEPVLMEKPALTPSLKRADPMPQLLYWLFVCQFLLSSSFCALVTIFPLLTADKYDFHGFETGLCFTFTSVAFVIMQVWGFSRCVSLFGKHITGMIGAAVFAASLVTLPLAPAAPYNLGVGITCLNLLVIAMAYGLIAPCLPTLVSRYADPKEMGKSIGLGDGFDCAGRIIAPMALTSLVEASGGTSVPFIAVGVCSALIAVLLGIVLTLNRRIQKASLLGNKEDLTEALLSQA